MQQVLVRIPTDTSWFLPIFVVLGLAAGVGIWAMFTRDKRALPVFMAGVAFLAYRLGLFLAERNREEGVPGIPIYGYGMMLFLAFLACTALAAHLARREGIAVEHIQDLAIYLFVGGVIGSRVVYMIQYERPWSEFFYIWEGGLVFYGGMAGGAVAYVVAYYTIIKKHNLSTLKLADIIAPCAALGLCLGRIGCLLNGCCYGEVACATCAATPIHFPLSGMPRQPLVNQGYQSAAGFTLDAELSENEMAKMAPAKVKAVEPGSSADRAGLHNGDAIVKADGYIIGFINKNGEYDLQKSDEAPQADGPKLDPVGWLKWYLRSDRKDWLRGKNDIQLTVLRDGKPDDLPAFRPQTLGLYPTQAYESISTALLLLLLLAYYPFRRHEGELFALFLMLYPLHRFLDEMLRADNEKVAFGLTLSQNGSILLFALGLIFFLWLRRLPAQFQPAKQPLPA